MPSQSRYLNLIADGIATAGSAQNSTGQNIAHRVDEQFASLFIRFTKGSLTNIVVKLQASWDGTTWYDVVGATTGTLTADGNYFISCAVKGAKKVRASYTATGTATSSSIGVDLGWQEW